jgi:hypothetical protein
MTSSSGGNRCGRTIICSSSGSTTIGGGWLALFYIDLVMALENRGCILHGWYLHCWRWWNMEMVWALISSLSDTSVYSRLTIPCSIPRRSPGGVARIRRDAQVEVRRFFIESGDNLVLMDGKSKVHKVNNLAWWTHNPFESEVWVVHRGFECLPSCIIGVWICDIPDSLILSMNLL